VKTWHIVGVAVASLLLGLGVMWAVVGPKAPSIANPPTAAAESLERAHAATAGKPDAKVHIVEFLDPACETCREFYPLVKKMLAENPERIRLSVRLVAFHRGSDFVVRALEASKKQGKFWEALERVLASQPIWAVQHVVKPELAWEQLAPLGLNLDQLRADMESPEVATAVALDAQDARLLKVTQTPEYFVNGKSMSTFGYEQLRQLVAEALASAYR
jgi:protein-disulfide isomerase